MTIRLALPAGDLRAPVAALLSGAGVSVNEYAAAGRSYRPVEEGEGVLMRVFRERDIPIQVALGNYDVAICGRLWVEEFKARGSAPTIVTLRSLDVGRQSVFVVRAREPLAPGPVVTVVSEFEGLANLFAAHARFARYRVLPLWGSAVNYPPEDADFAVVAAPGEEAIRAAGLEPVHRLLESTACVIVNRDALQSRRLEPLLGRLATLPSPGPAGAVVAAPSSIPPALGETRHRAPGVVRLAIPDGHQQRHTYASLRDAGLEFEGYGEKQSVVRPRSGIDRLEVKVIRPQDMAQQVALGQFDLAITGRDWLRDHLFQFPTSPVREVADLGRAGYSIAAVVDEDLPAETFAAAVAYWRANGRETLTIASEYRNIADQFAREQHLGRYRIVPIAGASEGFVPADAEVLIEGTETGTTLRANRLRMIEKMFYSTSCLIGRATPPEGPERALYDDLVSRLGRAAVTASA